MNRLQNIIHRLLPIALFLLGGSTASLAQVGEYRNEIALGVNGGYTMSNVGFNPDIPQTNLGGMTAGITLRSTCEKYFKSICALVAALNYTQMGWKEDLRNVDDMPVINPVTGMAEEYQRQLGYLQLPVFARLGWGREQKGFQFYFQAGPQVGYLLTEKTKMNFNYADRNQEERVGVQQLAPQDTMSVENKFDYGIAAGLGLEYSHPKVGHFLLEGRYYYGLGDLYGNSKRDFFGRSNNNCIVVKLTWLLDIKTTK